jgi:hypothetical protein
MPDNEFQVSRAMASDLATMFATLIKGVADIHASNPQPPVSAVQETVMLCAELGLELEQPTKRGWNG